MKVWEYYLNDAEAKIVQKCDAEIRRLSALLMEQRSAKRVIYDRAKKRRQRANAKENAK